MGGFNLVGVAAACGLSACTGGGAGNGATDWLVTPVVHLSDYFGCAIDTQGALECWATELSDEEPWYVEDQDLLSPPEGTFKDVWLATEWGVALDTDGQIHQWGRWASYLTPPPTEGGFESLWVYDNGAPQACAVHQDQSVECWGAMGNHDLAPAFDDHEWSLVCPGHSTNDDDWWLGEFVGVTTDGDVIYANPDDGEQVVDTASAAICVLEGNLLYLDADGGFDWFSQFSVEVTHHDEGIFALRFGALARGGHCGLAEEVGAWICPEWSPTNETVYLGFEPEQVLTITSTEDDVCAVLATDPPTISCLNENRHPAW